MRHRKGFNHLGRTSSHRKAMLANMASSLILHKRIKTTEAKAKALRMYLEPLITKSKDDSTHSRRVVFSYLKDKYAVSELFREVSPKITDRPGGYTRILKMGNRLGDNAEMCIIELVDFNTNMLEAQEAQKAKSTRRRRGGKKKPAEGTPAAQSESVEESEKEASVTTTEESEEPVAKLEEKEIKKEAEGKTDKSVVEKEEPIKEEEPEEIKNKAVEEKSAEKKEEKKVEAKQEEKPEAEEEKEESPEDKKGEDKKTE